MVESKSPEEDIPIPYKLTMKNFGSHRNTLIDFGEPYENVFFRGTSGMGKSHIIKAIQLVLGKKMRSDNEIFTYEVINGEKKFKRDTEIKLVLKNSGKNHLLCYPKDAEITVGVKLNRINKHNNHWFVIDHEGVKERKSKNDIQKIFGSGFDPLIFIPQGETRKFVDQPPSERYRLVTELIGIEDTQNQAKSALEELKKAKMNFEKKTFEHEKHQEKLNTLHERYKSFQKKVKIEGEIIQLKKDYIDSKLHKTFKDFRESETELNSSFQNTQDLEIQLESIEKKNKKYKKEVEKIEQDIQSLTEEENQLKIEIKEKEYKYTNWQKSLEGSISVIGLTTNEIKEKYTLNSILQEKKQLSNEFESIRAENHNKKREMDELKDKLESLNKGIVPLSPDHIKLKQLLNQNNIPNEFLYEVLDFKKDQDPWRSIFESILEYDKKAILVPENFQLTAEKLNRKNNFYVKLLAPRHNIAKNRAPKKDLRNWRTILEPIPKNLNNQTVFDIMDLIMGNSYFPEDPNELKVYRNESPYSRFACLDNYIYTIYSQDRIRPAKTSMIGRGAIQIEIQELTKKLKEVSSIHESNLISLNELQESINQSIEIEKALNLLNQNSKMKDLSSEIVKLNIKLDSIKLSLLNPEKIIEDYRTKINNNQDRIELLKTELKKERNRFQEIQKALQSLSENFNLYLTEWKEQTLENELEINIEDFFIEYKEKDIDYKGITDKINEFLKIVPIPTEDPRTIKIKIEQKESHLNDFVEFSNQDEENFINAKEEDERFREEIVDYDKEIERSEEQFNKADRQLLEELEQYKEKVNKIFRAVMNILDLDGSIEFSRQGSSVNFELNLKVANRIDGALDLFEESNFSGGEMQRTGVAFMVAIISQSRYPYVVWDEIDSDVGDDHREKIAEVIELFFTGRKVIALSPQVLIPGYKKAFPLIAEVFKNDDGFSRLTYTRPIIEKGVEDKDLSQFI